MYFISQIHFYSSWRIHSNLQGEIRVQRRTGLGNVVLAQTRSGSSNSGTSFDPSWTVFFKNTLTDNPLNYDSPRTRHVITCKVRSDFATTNLNFNKLNLYEFQRSIEKLNIFVTAKFFSVDFLSYKPTSNYDNLISYSWFGKCTILCALRSPSNLSLMKTFHHFRTCQISLPFRTSGALKTKSCSSKHSSFTENHFTEFGKCSQTNPLLSW